MKREGYSLYVEYILTHVFFNPVFKKGWKEIQQIFMQQLCLVVGCLFLIL